MPRHPDLNDTGGTCENEANDLEGPQDMGGKQGGQAGQPNPPPRPPAGESDSDVVPKRSQGDRGR
jgi:hypothetical protein